MMLQRITWARLRVCGACDSFLADDDEADYAD